MGSFGERLQREREMRGITLDEIATATKISARSLRALEEEDFAKLPGGIFNKGFVRAYAHYLGIDEEEAVADFLAVHGEEEQPLPNPPEKEEQAGARKSGSAKWVAVVLVLAIAAGFAAWRVGKLRLPARHAQQLNAARDIRVSQPQAAAPQTTPVSSPQAASPPTGQATNPPSQPQDAKRQAASSPAASPPQASATGNTAFTLDIKARQDSWIDIWVDGRHVTAETIKAAGERSFSANQKIVLRAGNAGGLEFSHNGKPLTIATKQGEPRTFTFTPDGLQQ